MNRRPTLSLVALALWLSATAGLAENSTKVPGYTIHHNALTTDALAPSIANAYQIRRSKNRAMLNVSVIKDVPGTTGQAVTADVRAASRNLMGQTQVIPMREIREGDAVYYIGDFLVGHRDNLTFDISVRPTGSDQVYTTKLSQEFYTD